MGRKRIRARQCIYFCLAGLISFVFFGCADTKKQVTSQEAIPAQVAKPVTQPAASPGGPGKTAIPVREDSSLKQADEHLRQARKLFVQKDYETALKVNQKVLSLTGKHSPGDEALFNLGLIYVQAENPRKDYAKSLSYFQRLVKEYPESPLVEEAKAWVGILHENENLREIIEKAKQVDITVDEKKREKGK